MNDGYGYGNLLDTFIIYGALESAWKLVEGWWRSKKLT